MLIAVAPNGARRDKNHHSTLPITPDELAQTALTCLEAGASMIHLHVRDGQNKHSISSQHYLPAIKAIRATVGQKMLIQVTSEAAGIFSRHQQMEAMLELMPDSVSIALRELVPDAGAEEEANAFFSRLDEAGTLIQYIIYSPEELQRYHALCTSGVIPRQQHLLLFVLGRYSEKLASESDLDDFIADYKGEAEWMCCAFGKNEEAIMRRAAQLGGHARVGFENNLQRQDGSLVTDNSELVSITATNAIGSGRTLATASQGRALYSHARSLPAHCTRETKNLS
jgi:3-keto-5-aminohexanoate cleavage enzyme